MWWWCLGGALLVSGGVTARPGMGRIAVAAVLLWLFFEVGRQRYLLPPDYYKDGGNGPGMFDWVWLLHALLWLIPVLIVGRVRRWLAVRSGR